VSTKAALLLLLASTAHASPIDRADQLIVVVTDGWTATEGRLFRAERRRGKLAIVGPPIRVVIGAAGLGWGRGLHPSSLPTALGGPTKQEGDLRSPAGAFALTRMTGDDATGPGTLQYTKATDDLRCVDDPSSPRYNEIVTAPPNARPWRSDEAMHRSDEIYRLTIVVAHNPPPVVAGAGSCIFFHAFDPKQAPTTGCTSLDPAALRSLATFLRASAHPMLVQLPQAVYDDLASTWKLPALPITGPPFRN
jgi:D-alanyl-D-alanine dipeptidase